MHPDGRGGGTDGRVGLGMGKLYEDHKPLIYDMEVNVSKITFLDSQCTASVIASG